MADLSLKNKIKDTAYKLGREISKINACLLFSFEGDFNSLPIIAAKSAEKRGGKTVAFIWCMSSGDFPLKSITVETGQMRGGGREFSFVLSCNSIICIG